MIHEEEEIEVHDALTASNQLEPEEDQDFVSEPSSSPYLSNTGRPGIGTIPRTIPLYLNGNGSRTGYKHYTSQSVGSVPSNYSPTKGEREEDENDLVTKSFTGSIPHTDGSDGGIALDWNLASSGNFTPLTQTSTGTRYGVALSGGVGVHMTGSTSPGPKKWGAGTPVCPRCMKNVYFAEQVNLYPSFLLKVSIPSSAQVKAVGKTFHKTCLRCAECGTSLHSNKLLDHDGDPFCVRCHNKVFHLFSLLKADAHCSKALWASRQRICIAWEGGRLKLFISRAALFRLISMTGGQHARTRT